MSSEEFTAIMKRLDAIERSLGNAEEWSRSRVVEYLGCDNSTITRWIDAGTLVPTKRSTPRKQFFMASHVKSLKK